MKIGEKELIPSWWVFFERKRGMYQKITLESTISCFEIAQSVNLETNYAIEDNMLDESEKEFFVDDAPEPPSWKYICFEDDHIVSSIRNLQNGIFKMTERNYSFFMDSTPMEVLLLKREYHFLKKPNLVIMFDNKGTSYITSKLQKDWKETKSQLIEDEKMFLKICRIKDVDDGFPFF